MRICARDVTLEVRRPPLERPAHSPQALAEASQRQVARPFVREMRVNQVDQVEEVAVETDDLRAVVVLVQRVVLFRGIAARGMRGSWLWRCEAEQVLDGGARCVDTLLAERE